MRWKDDPDGACIFWLNGMAGMGKSTIAFTVASTCADELGASFFFSKGHTDLGNSTKFFITLAVQLAKKIPALQHDILTAMTDHPDIYHRGLREQWELLIFQPLSSLRDAPPQQSVVFVIDALDECEEGNDIPVILQLLARSKTLNTIRLRVLVTSRPEVPIRFGFDQISPAHQDFILHNIPEPIIQHDISLFLYHELGNIARSHKLPQFWPGESTIERLCLLAGGLFIYASTVCQFIQGPLWGSSWTPQESLSMILKSNYQGLDQMYKGVLERSLGHGPIHPQLQLTVNQIVGSIIVLLEPLPVITLAKLINIGLDTVHFRLRCLYSVLDVPENPESESSIRLLHPSFRDFLLDNQRCQDQRFWVDEKKAHDHLFICCLELMSKCLKADICDLRLPGTLVSEVEERVIHSHLPPDVQYACRYWVVHLQRGGIESNDQRVHQFLQKCLLHWLEALSLMGKLPDGLDAVNNLESMCTLPALMVSLSLGLI